MVNPRPNPHLYVEAGVIYHEDVVATEAGPKESTRSIGTVAKDDDGFWTTRDNHGKRAVSARKTRQAAIEEHDRRFHEARAMGPLR